MTINQKIKLIKVRQEYQLEHANEYGKKAEMLEKILNAKNELSGYVIGYHTPAGTNWCYTIEIVNVEGELYEIVKRFGQTIAADWIGLPEYTEQDLKINENEL